MRARKPRLLLVLAALSALAGAHPAATAPSREIAVLLHGLGRSDRSMRPLERRLASAGFEVRSLHYPSTERTPDELVAYLDAELGRCCTGAARLHFVTHSLGGILVRAYLQEHRPPRLGRVVMLAPPNRGSEYVDRFGASPLFREVLGPTAAELGTGPDSLPNRLPPPDFEFGVIAGTRSANPLAELVIPGENDGTVSVASTQLPGMADFVKVPTTHTAIMGSDEVARHVVEFLRHGHFAREPRNSARGD